MWTTTLSTGALGAVASLDGVLSGWTICGLNIFDSLDYLTANIMLPVGGLLTLVLLRYFCPVILLLVFLDNLGVF